MIAMIAAMTENRVIGKGNDIPWKIPGEQKRFRELTTGHTVIMGRRTFESMGAKPLPNRRNIVITRSHDFIPKCETAHSLFEALTLAEKNDNQIFIGGGQTVYEEALPFTDRIYLTIIHSELDGDTFFPEFSMDEFEEIERHFVDGPQPYTYLTYQRKPKVQN